MKFLQCAHVYAVLLALLTSFATAAAPFHGTIFLDPDIIRDDDATAFESLEYVGQESREMFDRRINGWAENDAFLFVANYNDGLQIEFQVNPEFGEVEAARAEVEFYAPVIGRLPRAVRERVRTSWIHRGDQLFGGGNDNLLIHTGETAQSYIRDGILEEALVHEGAHTSLDPEWGEHDDWRAAQASDAGFISAYARDNPESEDIAETWLLYLAVSCRSDRIDASLLTTVTETVPARLAFFEALELDLSPLECVDSASDE